jgi:hypothetical protein
MTYDLGLSYMKPLSGQWNMAERSLECVVGNLKTSATNIVSKGPACSLFLSAE